MKTVSFTENEIDYIKELYLQELERLKQRTDTVKVLLDRLQHLEGSKDASSGGRRKNEVSSKKIGQNSEAAVENELKALLQAPKRTAARKDTRGRKEKAAKAKPRAIATGEKGRPGRKKSADSKRSIWTASILDTLANSGKVLPSPAIIEETMKKQNVPQSELSKIRSMVGGILISLKKENKIKTISNPGKRGELYGLSEWFDAGGNLDQSKS